ncbi:MAG: bacteriorhodopsin, partial [Bacteroidota bacterium]
SFPWKTSLLVSGLITMIAAVHYFYMRDYYLATGDSPTEFRYIDWTLTVPLMCVEFYLLLRPYGAKSSLMWLLILASAEMLVTGYIGEAIDPGNTVLWGFLSTLGYLYIVYEASFGSVKKMADASNNPNVVTAVRLMRNFVVVGWAIYPIGYMTMQGNWLEGMFAMDLIYNIGDAVNKIGFGLVVYMVAVNSTRETAAATA